MSTDTELLAIRRAVYADALRRGDPLAMANAAARLRAHIGDLDAAELEAVRASRRNFGQAIRQARSRRVPVPVPALPPVTAIPLRRPGGFPFALVASIVILAVALTGLLAQPQDQNDDGGGGAPAAVASDPTITAQSRGRVVLAVAAAAPVAVESAPAAASATPTSGASAASGSPAPSGSGVPGSGTGSGSGGGSGSGSPTPTPGASRTPAPTFAICLSSVPRGFARLCGQVVDARTGRGIAGACVSLGPCTDQSARTDPNGRWTFTLPVGNGTLTWILEFSKAGYGTSTYSQTSRQGRLTIPTQRLAPTP